MMYVWQRHKFLPQSVDVQDVSFVYDTYVAVLDSFFPRPPVMEKIASFIQTSLHETKDFWKAFLHRFSAN